MWSTATTRQRRHQESSSQEQETHANRFFRQKKVNPAKKQRQKRSLAHRTLGFGAGLLGLALWYLTPISDVVVEVMLWQVPLQADIDLGRQAAMPVGRNGKNKLNRQHINLAKSVHHKKWTPALKSIGRELVQECAPKLSSSFQKAATVYDWNFAVSPDTSTVNAYALPDGTIRVTTALLEKLQPTAAELAALLGHEMGHVLHRHAQSRILSTQVLDTLLRAVFYSDDDPHEENFGEAVGELLLQSADWLGRQSYSRANEYQADEMSFALLRASVQYNPAAMEKLLMKLWDFHGRVGGQTSWESTHPGTLDRIGALKDKWKALPIPEQQRFSRRH